jgi:hypothetical protein
MRLDEHNACGNCGGDWRPGSGFVIDAYDPEGKRYTWDVLCGPPCLAEWSMKVLLDRHDQIENELRELVKSTEPPTEPPTP